MILHPCECADVVPLTTVEGEVNYLDFFVISQVHQFIIVRNNAIYVTHIAPLQLVQLFNVLIELLNAVVRKRVEVLIL